MILISTSTDFDITIISGSTELIPITTMISTDVDIEMLNGMNTIRESRGLPPFKAHGKLKEAARKHAEYMRDNVMFSHYGENRNTWIDRAKAAGYNSNSIGENIGYGQASVEQIIGDWMGSPGHAAQILSLTNVHVGSSVALDPGGRGYWCTVFGLGGSDESAKTKLSKEDFKFV